MKSKLKGRKIPYKDRWNENELRPAFALQGTPAGHRIRALIAEIRREHRTRRPYPKEDT